MIDEEHFSLDGRCAQCPGTLIAHRGCRASGTLKLTEKQAEEWRQVSATQNRQTVTDDARGGRPG